MTGKTVGSIRRTSKRVPGGSDGQHPVDLRLDLEHGRRSCPSPQSKSTPISALPRLVVDWTPADAGDGAHRLLDRAGDLDDHPLGRAVAGVEVDAHAREADLREQAHRQPQRAGRPRRRPGATRRKRMERAWRCAQEAILKARPPGSGRSSPGRSSRAMRGTSWREPSSWAASLVAGLRPPCRLPIRSCRRRRRAGLPSGRRPRPAPPVGLDADLTSCLPAWPSFNGEQDETRLRPAAPPRAATTSRVRRIGDSVGR